MYNKNQYIALNTYQIDELSPTSLQISNFNPVNLVEQAGLELNPSELAVINFKDTLNNSKNVLLFSDELKNIQEFSLALSQFNDLNISNSVANALVRTYLSTYDFLNSSNFRDNVTTVIEDFDIPVGNYIFYMRLIEIIRSEIPDNLTLQIDPNAIFAIIDDYTKFPSSSTDTNTAFKRGLLDSFETLVEEFLHPRQHLVTSTADHIAANPNRIFYSDADRSIQELNFGTNGQYLKSNGPNTAPSWATLNIPEKLHAITSDYHSANPNNLFYSNNIGKITEFPLNSTSTSKLLISRSNTLEWKSYNEVNRIFMNLPVQSAKVNHYITNAASIRGDTNRWYLCFKNNQMADFQFVSPINGRIKVTFHYSPETNDTINIEWNFKIQQLNSNGVVETFSSAITTERTITTSMTNLAGKAASTTFTFNDSVTNGNFLLFIIKRQNSSAVTTDIRIPAILLEWIAD
jgi:hypothetical protein